MHRRSISLAAAAAFLAVSSTVLEAQFTSSPSVLSLLEPQATLSLGAEVAGQLTNGDYEYTGELVQAFAFEGGQGDPLTIDALSDDFDSYLYLLGPDGLQLEYDDDSGGACNARISTFLPSDGQYTIVVASLTGGTGAFTVRADSRQQPAATGPCGGADISDELLDELNAASITGSLEMGGEVTGQLETGDPRLPDGSFMKAYEIGGTAGDRVVIDLVSRAFDALVLVVEPDGSAYTTDDDSGGACNSRIEVTLGNAPHKVVVTSFVSDGAGFFTLRASETWGPEDTGDCPGF